MEIDKEMVSPLGAFNQDMIERQYIISPSKFLILTTLSCGLYSFWWTYKVWKFLIDRKKSNGNPALRTLFDIVYFIPRCQQILNLAKHKGYNKTYAATLLYLPYLLLVSFSLADPPLFLIWPLSGIFLVPPLKAFNYVLSESPELDVVIDRRLSVTELIIVILGGILWLLLIVGMLAVLLSE